MHVSDHTPEYLYRIEVRKGQGQWLGWFRGGIIDLIEGNVDNTALEELTDELFTLGSRIVHPEGLNADVRFWYTEAGYEQNKRVVDLLQQALAMNTEGAHYEVQVRRQPRLHGWLSADDLQVAYPHDFDNQGTDEVIRGPICIP
ncbi:hypothetical protein [Deinococcus carri]